MTKVPKVEKIIDLVSLRISGKKKMRKAFTLLELAVAVGLLAMMILFASLIFNMSIDTYRMATANAEIMQKLQAITGQLNADFKGLRKDGEIFVVWVAEPNSHERFDRIMFFADGDFQSYGTYGGDQIRGNLARISYMLAKTKDKNGNWIRAPQQAPEKRILARTQHIITSALPAYDPYALDEELCGVGPPTLDIWHNIYEYDTIPLAGWMIISRAPWTCKDERLTAITDVFIGGVGAEVWRIGAKVDPADPCSIHMLLCEGVGEFKVQGWYAAEQRWVPEVDPDGNGNLADSDFFTSGGGLDSVQVPKVLYPYPPYGFVSLGGAFGGNNFQGLLNEANFDYIPGLGRALKFTFTLYDSKGVIKNGKTFTHIVYLGD